FFSFKQKTAYYIETLLEFRRVLFRSVNILIIISAIVMITLIVLQPGKSQGLSGAISGGAEQLFGKKKARGLELVLHRGTIITAIIFFVLAFLSAYVL